jgi:hypothetical protein
MFSITKGVLETPLPKEDVIARADVIFPDMNGFVDNVNRTVVQHLRERRFINVSNNGRTWTLLEEGVRYLDAKRITLGFE